RWGSPPFDWRMSFAMDRANPRSVERRFTLNAIKGARAPMTMAPAVLWRWGGPKSGVQSGSEAICRPHARMDTPMLPKINKIRRHANRAKSRFSDGVRFTGKAQD